MDDDPIWTDGVFLAVDLVLALGIACKLRWAALVVPEQQVVFSSYFVAIELKDGHPSLLQELFPPLCVLGLSALWAIRRAAR